MDPATISGLKGKRIGITAGSRGLPHYKELVKAICDQLKEWGAEPFVFRLWVAMQVQQPKARKIISLSSVCLKST